MKESFLCCPFPLKHYYEVPESCNQLATGQLFVIESYLVPCLWSLNRTRDFSVAIQCCLYHCQSSFSQSYPGLQTPSLLGLQKYIQIRVIPHSLQHNYFQKCVSYLLIINLNYYTIFQASGLVFYFPESSICTIFGGSSFKKKSGHIGLLLTTLQRCSVLLKCLHS